MDKLRSNRKAASSPKNVARMTEIIASGWDEIWKVVETRAKINKEINRRRLRGFSQNVSDDIRLVQRGGNRDTIEKGCNPC